MAVAQYRYGDRDEHEGAECSHIGERSQDADRKERARGRNQNTEQNLRDPRRAPGRMQSNEQRGDQSVPRHRVKYSGLSVHHDEEHRRQTSDGTERNDHARPCEPDAVDRKRNGEVDVERVERHHAVENRYDDNIENRADHEACDDADRQIACRIPRLFGGRRDGVESDVREEDEGGSAEHSGPTEGEEAARTGERARRKVIVGGIDVTETDRDEEEYDGNLNCDDDRVDGTRFLRSAHEQCGYQKDDRSCGQVRDSRRRIPMAVLPRLWDVQIEQRVQNEIKIAGPSDADGRRAERIFEDQRPADDPSQELAERRIGIGVGAAGDWNLAGDLRVTERGQRAHDAGDDKRKR